MKKLGLILTIIGLVSFSALQAQIVADFEVEALGTQGFVDNGWGAGLTSVERIADPTGRSAGVLAVGIDGSQDWRGVFEKPSFSPENAHLVSIMVYLPADYPDIGVVELFGQDNAVWAHNVQTYQVADLPKETWVVLNFAIYSVFLATPGQLDPYAPHQFGRWGVQLQVGDDTVYDNTYTGQVLFDDLTLLGDDPKVISDFEVEAEGLDGWFNANWGPGLAAEGLQRAADPAGESEAALAVPIDASLGQRATLELDNVSITDDDHVIGVQVWVPADYPDSAFVQIVGQDNIYWAWHPEMYYGVDLVKGQWNEIYYYVLSMYTIDNSTFDPYTNGTWGKIIIDWDNFSGVPFTGTVYVDNITYLGPAEVQTAELASPPITVTAGVDTIADPYNGAKLYYNAIEWTDIAVDIGESYNLYYSESGKITDVTAPGVVQISTRIPRGVERYNHRIYTESGGSKTVYYAMTATGVEEGSVVEKPVIDGVSNSDAVTARTSHLYEIPLVSDFSFVADAYLDEFEDLAETFTRFPYRTENTGELHGPEWTTESTDLNFVGYIVMDADNYYLGFEVTDDNPTGDGQCWEGDGFDIYGGLYDVSTLTSLYRGDDCQRGGDLGGGYRIGAAINQDDQIEVGGWESWAGDGIVYAQEIFSDGYIVEAKIPFASMNDYFGSSFVPASGMILPLKIDVNDNDGAEDNPGGGNNRSLQCHFADTPANFQSWQRAETWGGVAMVTETPLSDVEEEVAGKAFTFKLESNFPNPFNPSTTINYEVPYTTDVSIVVYDVLGKEVCKLVDAKEKAGAHTVQWDGSNNAGLQVASGIYFYKMVTPEFTNIQKMMLLK